jgi:hypothetical protein
MVRARTLSVILLGCCFLGSQTPLEDPVMKARAERAQAQGIGEGDLPPLPKGVVEPPPLPPPETHAKDTRGGRLARNRHGRTSTHKKSKSKSKSSASSHGSSKPPAKGGRKHKKVKA